MAVRADLNISLDGRATTTDQTPENPFGDDWGRIVGPYTATRTFRRRVLGDRSGAGTTGVDDRYAEAYFEAVGAEIMGAGMFGLHQNPDDDAWQGWWGDEPPFHVPVFVLTHRERDDLEFANGTRFQFLAATAQDALQRAADVAGGGDIRIGGGVDVIRQFLSAGLIDRLHLAVTPVVIGSGENIWNGLRGIENGFAVTSEVAESGVTHLTFTRR